MTTFADIQNSTREYHTQMTFSGGLDSLTLVNIFLEAAVAAQTSTTPLPSIACLQVKGGMCIARFYDTTSPANMRHHLNRLLENRIPSDVREHYRIDISEDTIVKPRPRVA